MDENDGALLLFLVIMLVGSLAMFEADKIGKERVAARKLAAKGVAAQCDTTSVNPPNGYQFTQ